MTLRLSPRLRAVADLVLPGHPAADVGCDHAHLAAWWLTTRVVPRAVAIDNRSGPLEAARARLEEAGIGGVEFRRGDGLAPLRPAEVSTIAIAGMGGALICRLLAAHPDVLAHTTRVILQPNTAWKEVRRQLAGQGIPLQVETITEDAGQTYLTMAFDPRARGATWDDHDLELGPLLRRSTCAAFRRWTERHRTHLRSLTDDLRASLGASHPRVLELQDAQRQFQRSLDAKNRPM